MQRELRTALAGLGLLALALGIGRFVLTPLLPLMQADSGLGLVAGGWLASANMGGYMLGALLCALLPLPQHVALRGGLLLVVAATVGMGLGNDMAVWIPWRFAAGVGSAALVVHGIAWSMTRLRAAGRPRLEHVVFSGTGVGIVGSGVLVAVLHPLGIGSPAFWLGFGMLAALLAAAIWPSLGDAHAPAQPAATAASPPASGPAWTLALMYGLLGFAYMIPGAFLPLIAERQLHLPDLREWFWPLYGAAMTTATLALRWLPARVDNRSALAGCCVSMLAGMLLCVVWPSVPGLLAGTVLVGGATMPVVMFVMREARLLAPRNPTRLIATLTTSFGTGQIMGPLAGAWLAERTHGFDIPMLIGAVAATMALACTLPRTRRAGTRLGLSDQVRAGVTRLSVRRSQAHRRRQAGCLSRQRAEEMRQTDGPAF